MYEMIRCAASAAHFLSLHCKRDKIFLPLKNSSEFQRCGVGNGEGQKKYIFAASLKQSQDAFYFLSNL